jgi:hypothetical protein
MVRSSVPLLNSFGSVWVTSTVAITNETKLEDLVGEENAAIMRNGYWEDVVSIKWKDPDFVTAFGAGLPLRLEEAMARMAIRPAVI